MYSRLVEAGLPLLVCFAAAPEAVKTNSIMRDMYSTFADIGGPPFPLIAEDPGTHNMLSARDY